MPKKENPIRVKFFDDDIESIIFYNIEIKKSIEIIDTIKILPYRIYNKNEVDDDNIRTIINYFGDEYIVFLDEVKNLKIQLIYL